MGLTCKNVQAVQAFLKKAANLLQQYCKQALSKLGDECVAKIRNRTGDESWIDQTGNLRSSIGFAVYDNGIVFMQSTFKVVLQGSEGAANGNKMIRDLAKEFSRVYALVVLAGMEYASNVEHIKSKDVLESTKIWALSVVKKRVETAIDAAINEINKWTT